MGHLGGSVDSASSSWFRLKSWPHGLEMEPQVGLCAGCGASLRFSVSALPLVCRAFSLKATTATTTHSFVSPASFCRFGWGLEHINSEKFSKWFRRKNLVWTRFNTNEMMWNTSQVSDLILTSSPKYILLSTIWVTEAKTFIVCFHFFLPLVW